MAKPVKCIGLPAARALARKILSEGGCQAAARKHGLNAGLVSEIRRGLRQASPRTLAVLGIAYYEEAPAPVCRAHGKVCSTQHKPRKTFEQNAAEYEAWLKRNLERLLEIVKLYE